MLLQQSFAYISGCLGQKPSLAQSRLILLNMREGLIDEIKWHIEQGSNETRCAEYPQAQIAHDTIAVLELLRPAPATWIGSSLTSRSPGAESRGFVSRIL